LNSPGRDIVEGVYDAVTATRQWPAALAAICRAAEGCIATLGVVDTVSKEARFSVGCGDDRILAPLVSGVGVKLTFYDALPLMDIDTPYTADTLYAVQGPGAREAWLASSAVRDWVIPNRLDDFLWVALMKKPGRAGNLVIVTDKDRRQISPGDLAFMAELAPHVRRAVTIGDLFEAERPTADMFRDIVEALFHPVLIVGRNMEIIFANPAAEALLADGAAIGQAQGRLFLSFEPARSAVARAVDTGVRDECALGPSGIDVPLARAMAPAVAHVMPLARRDVTARFATHAAAAIFISVAGAAPLPAMEAIAALFGLTASEKRVAGQVAAGLSRQEIAASAGVADGTVKSHLSAIFDKTGASDQRALGQIIRDLAPPLR
jgi:DNA-binding CsgD family transcriptional regulator/PAS domain-containing protein